ncbi:helix-turn-helix transcriptional regulator [Thermococcus sp.]
MKAKAIAIALLLLFIAGMVSAQYTNESLTLTVYSDGYVKVDQYIKPENYVVSVTVPLLAKDVTGLTILDDNGNPLPYKVNGSKVTVYFENVTRIHIRYYTPDLTSKNGAIWTLKINWNSTPLKIIFPKNAVIIDLSDIPLEISGDTLTMPPGNQTISYVIQYSSPEPTETTTSTLPSQTTTTQSNLTMPSSPTASNPGSSTGTNWTPILIGIAVVVGLAFGFTYLKKPGAKKGEESEAGMSREDFERYLKKFDLTKEEEKALLYIFDRGGEAKQAEVRDMLGIPKTTAWRMFQRLEKQGLVRIYKKRRENWVELVL